MDSFFDNREVLSRRFIHSDSHVDYAYEAAEGLIYVSLTLFAEFEHQFRQLDGQYRTQKNVRYFQSLEMVGHANGNDLFEISDLGSRRCTGPYSVIDGVKTLLVESIDLTCRDGSKLTICGDTGALTAADGGRVLSLTRIYDTGRLRALLERNLIVKPISSDNCQVREVATAPQ